MSLNKRYYSELAKIKDIIEKILKSEKVKKPKKDGCKKAFDILKEGFKKEISNTFQRLKI